MKDPEDAHWLETNHPALAAAVADLPWVADRVDASEGEVLDELARLGRSFAAINGERSLEGKEVALD